MPSPLRLALLASLIAVVGCGGELLAQAGPRPTAAWAHLQSDLPADPAIRFGTLPNGMRYALRRNATPPGDVVVRMRIGAGSLVERDDQRGLAHFLEHLTYRGTTNLPGNEVIQRLQREGTEVRATTGFNETMYALDFPRGEASLDTGLHVLREMMSEATLAADAIDQERGVVQGEQRSKDGSYIRGQTARLQFVAPRLGTRMTIGDMEIIRTATRERIAHFYNAYYRPSRATLVVVGDLDLDRVEALIRRRFADWTPKGPAGPDANRREAERRAPQARIMTGAGADSSFSLIWVRPPDRSPDSRATRRRMISQELGIAVLRERVGQLGRSDAVPFERASVSFDDTWGAAQAINLSGSYKPGQLDPALAAAEQVPRQLLRYGITDAELRRQIAATRTRLQAEVAGGAAQSSSGHAENIVRAVGEGAVVTSAQAELALFDETVKSLTAADVMSAMQLLFTDAGPLAMISTPTAIPGGETAVLARLKAARQLPVSPPVLQAEAIWPYTDFGEPGTVASRRQIAGIDATVVNFANGTILTIKPTNFALGEILVTASTGLGESGMSADRLDPLYGAQAYLTAGGLGKLTPDQLEQVLAGRTVAASGLVESNRFRWYASTRPEDLTLQMQLLAAYVTDPGLRPEPLERFKARYAAPTTLSAASPGDALARRVRELLSGGDKRAAPPSREEIQSLDMRVAGPRLREAIGRGPVRVVVVGDVTVDQAIAATASTFGALAPRGAALVPPAQPERRRTLPGGGGIVELNHMGPATQALATVVWPGPDRLDNERDFRRAEVLGQILQFRVSEIIRARLGLAYSPSAGFGGVGAVRGTSQFSASAETTPQNTAAFHAAMDGIVRDLQTVAVTRDELDRARTPLIGRSQGQRTRNDYWIDILEAIGTRPELATEQSETADYQAITPADIQALARRYLRPELAWRASVTPAAPAQTSSSALPRE